MAHISKIGARIALEVRGKREDVENIPAAEVMDPKYVARCMNK